MIRLEFEAPYPPSTNNLYRTVIANGRPVRVKTGKAKEYGQAVGQRVGIALALAGATPQPPYALHLSVWMPDAARRDLSNTIKALEDAIFGVLHKADGIRRRAAADRRRRRAPGPALLGVRLGGGGLMRVLSLGAGVQSSTLLLMGVHGELQIDRAVFADTQWEPKAVYQWLEYLMPLAEKAGIPVDVVTGGNLRAAAVGSTRSASIPLHVLNRDGTPGMLRRQCTKEYKVRPVQRRIRELGATAANPVTLLIGISWDEAQRMADSRVKYATHEYPLVERRMTRRDCLAWLSERGYPQPPKSACIGCPFMDDRRWRELRDTSPEEWADAVAFDAAIRTNTRIDGEAYLHRSLVPLPLVDLRTPQDRGQLEMFDDVSDGECGAFSCFAGGEG